MMSYLVLGLIMGSCHFFLFVCFDLKAMFSLKAFAKEKGKKGPLEGNPPYMAI